MGEGAHRPRTATSTTANYTSEVSVIRGDGGVGVVSAPMIVVVVMMAVPAAAFGVGRAPPDRRRR